MLRHYRLAVTAFYVWPLTMKWRRFVLLRIFWPALPQGGWPRGNGAETYRAV
jgi:hypothetical protein